MVNYFSVIGVLDLTLFKDDPVNGKELIKDQIVATAKQTFGDWYVSEDREFPKADTEVSDQSGIIITDDQIHIRIDFLLNLEDLCSEDKTVFDAVDIVGTCARHKIGELLSFSQELNNELSFIGPDVDSRRFANGD